MRKSESYPKVVYRPHRELGYKGSIFNAFARVTFVGENMARRLFIHAVNVHQGGGGALLSPLLEELPEGLEVIALLDARMPLSEKMLANVQIESVEPSVMRRLRAEWWLSRNVKPGDVVLCFGNLPPLFRSRGYTKVFVQNRYLIDGVRLASFTLKVRIRLSIERLWFSWKAKNANGFIVQTPSMKEQLASMERTNAPIQVMPFVGEARGYARSINKQGSQSNHRHDFLYVASGEPHKNHRQLIEAWCLLATENIFPTLRLTLDENISTDLCNWMAGKKKQYGLRLENLGLMPHAQIKQIYSQVGALIYPSTFESLGLPLIEARQAGLPVLAAELDYVRDVLDPEQSFDPESAVSIAKAVKRYMGLDEQALPLLDASDFLNQILKK